MGGGGGVTKKCQKGFYIENAWGRAGPLNVAQYMERYFGKNTEKKEEKGTLAN